MNHMNLIKSNVDRRNLASLPLIVVPAICKEQNNPFGDEVVCHTKGLAYASLSMVV
ncbi:hypothetical protein Fmac_027389 [Flemingia macrophylla]|uniref:Uncharacterized protein n=1 Tax=Flemingia macrophylla TaxID=520843 RepID=A0ABD1LHJ0_9FABA